MPVQHVYFEGVEFICCVRMAIGKYTLSKTGQESVSYGKNQDMAKMFLVWVCVMHPKHKLFLERFDAMIVKGVWKRNG